MEPPPMDSMEWSIVPPHVNPEASGPIWVDVRFDIRKVGSIDTKNTNAFIKLRVYYYWTDPRLADWGKVGCEGQVGVKRNGRFITRLPGLVWGPVFNLANSIGDMKVTQDEFTMLDSKEGRLRRVHLYEGRIDNDMDLSDFPFDIDDVAVQFTSQSRWSTMDGSHSGRAAGVQTYRVRRVCRPEEGNVMTLTMASDVFEFRLHGVGTTIRETKAVREGEVMTLIDVNFIVSRDYMFYVWKVMLPLVLLTLFSFQVFLFHPRALAQRASTSATYFLAIFAMLYTLGNHIPKTDFLTSVDKIIVLTIIALGVGGLSSTVLYLYVNKFQLPVSNNVIIDLTKAPVGSRDVTACAWNTVIAMATVGVFLFANVVIFGPIVVRATRLKSELEENWYPREGANTSSSNPIFDEPEEDDLENRVRAGYKASTHKKPLRIDDRCWFETHQFIRNQRTANPLDRTE